MLALVEDAAVGDESHRGYAACSRES